eukprot:4300509-Alexandrium_andersonii.AAC.1
MQHESDTLGVAYDCCCESGWTRPVRDAMLKQAAADRPSFLLRMWHAWANSLRTTSLREEVTHALQRHLAAGYRARPKAFATQASGI